MFGQEACLLVDIWFGVFDEEPPENKKAHDKHVKLRLLILGTKYFLETLVPFESTWWRNSQSCHSAKWDLKENMLWKNKGPKSLIVDWISDGTSSWRGPRAITKKNRNQRSVLLKQSVMKMTTSLILSLRMSPKTPEVDWGKKKTIGTCWTANQWITATCWWNREKSSRSGTRSKSLWNAKWGGVQWATRAR